MATTFLTPTPRELIATLQAIPDEYKDVPMYADLPRELEGSGWRISGISLVSKLGASTGKSVRILIG